MTRLTYNAGDVVDDMHLIKREYTNKREVRYLVECLKCGRTKTMLSQNISLSRGTTHKACSQGYRKKYPKLYYAWNGLVSRIDNPNDARYKDYGGRGLTHDFEFFIDFVDHMLPSYLELPDGIDSRDITIDRIDNDLGYVKGNLRWATQREQASNRRTSLEFVAYSPCGDVFMTKNAAKFARDKGLWYEAVLECLKGKRKQYKGWRFEPTSEMCVEAIERVSS